LLDVLLPARDRHLERARSDMGAVPWIVVALAVAGIVIAGLRRRTGGGRYTDVDVGPVSEGWLSEQRGRKDS
jgi:hypothetical protein